MLDTPLWVHKKCDIESEIKEHQLIIDELKKSGIQEEAESIQIEKTIIKSLEEEITRIRLQSGEERASNRCSHYSKHVKSLLSDKHNNIVTWSGKSTEQWEVFVTEVYSRIDHIVIDKWFDTLRHQLDAPDVIPSFYTQTNVGEKIRMILNQIRYRPDNIKYEAVIMLIQLKQYNLAQFMLDINELGINDASLTGKNFDSRCDEFVRLIIASGSMKTYWKLVKMLEDKKLYRIASQLDTEKPQKVATVGGLFPHTVPPIKQPQGSPIVNPPTSKPTQGFSFNPPPEKPKPPKAATFTFPPDNNGFMRPSTNMTSIFGETVKTAELSLPLFGHPLKTTAESIFCGEPAKGTVANKPLFGEPAVMKSTGVPEDFTKFNKFWTFGSENKGKTFGRIDNFQLLQKMTQIEESINDLKRKLIDDKFVAVEHHKQDFTLF